MKTPRFTDAHKYPHGYRSSARTNIRATFIRARAALNKDAEERAQKVQPMRKKATA